MVRRPGFYVAMAFEKIKVDQPIVEMDGEPPGAVVLECLFRPVIKLLRVVLGIWSFEIQVYSVSLTFFHACLTGDRTRGSGSMLLSLDMSGVDVLTFKIGMYSCSPGTWSNCE